MDLKLPSTNETVMQNALYFAHLSNAAYFDKPEDYRKFAQFAFADWDTFQGVGGENFGIAARVDGALIVALRGTDDANDWWNDLQFGQVDDYVGKVHSGFYAAANNVWKEMTRLLGKWWQQGDVVWVAGHSLGGAMATLATNWLDHDKYNIAGVFTFGQPRVGNNPYADAYPAPDSHYRFVNNKDIVPQVPYRWMPPNFQYKHVGKIYHFDKDGNLSRSDSTWDKLVETFTDNTLIRTALPKGKLPDFGFADHGIEKYIARIEEALGD